MRWKRPWLYATGTLLLAAFGCSPRTGASAGAPTAAPSVAPKERAPATSTLSLAPAPKDVIEEEYDALVVGNAQGLYRVERDGSGARLISPGAALSPRWLSLGSVLVIRPRLAANLERGAVLERVALRDGQRTLVAELPTFSCGAAPAEHGLGLDVQDPRDFRIVHEAHVACLRLMDRNANMANLVLDAEIDLKNGGVQRSLSVAEPACQTPLPARSVQAPSPCRADTAGEERLVESVSAYPFTFEHERLLDTTHANRVVLTLHGYEEEEMSPSGRWLVLGGDPVESDFLYRRLLLLDRQEGTLFALGDKPATWPEPLMRPGKKARTLATPIEAAALVPRETEARWLGDAELELLALGALVVPPGKASFELPGELVR